VVCTRPCEALQALRQGDDFDIRILHGALRTGIRSEIEGRKTDVVAWWAEFELRLHA
jgi:hypothetical protein